MSTKTKHPLEGNRKLRQLAALYRTQGSNGGTRLAALRAGIEAIHGGLPSYLERRTPTHIQEQTMTKAKSAAATFNVDFTSVQEAQHRLTQLGQGLDAVRAAAAQYAALRDAFERLPVIEAEIDAIRAALPEIERADFERQVDAYEIDIIQGTMSGDETNGRAGFPTYNVHGVYRGQPFTAPLANQSRVLLAAVARRPELIPAEILARAEQPLEALLRNVRDVNRGWRD
jgi:hypothetical protein